jgi:hypothetical protein
MGKLVEARRFQLAVSTQQRAWRLRRMLCFIAAGGSLLFVQEFWLAKPDREAGLRLCKPNGRSAGSEQRLTSVAQNGSEEMMQYKWTLFCLCLSFAACSKNAEVQDFVKEQDALVAEITAASNADAAQKAFDAKKADLKAKLAPLKTARGFQVSKESMTALTTSLTSGVTSVCGLQLKAITDVAEGAKYKALCDDYTSTMTAN